MDSSVSDSDNARMAALEERVEQKLMMYQESEKMLKEALKEKNGMLCEIFAAQKALEEHKKNLMQDRKNLERQNKEWKKRYETLQQENRSLQVDTIKALIAGDEMRAEMNRVVLVLINQQALWDRKMAALSKIFGEKEEEEVTETEATVIDHCLRQLTDDERAKFLCE